MSPATVVDGSGPYSVTGLPSGNYADVTKSTGNAVSQFMIGTNSETLFAISFMHAV